MSEPAPRRKWLAGLSFAASLLVGALAVVAEFWLRVGDASFGMAVAAFLMLVAITVRLTDRLPAPAEAQPHQRSPFDFLGVIWLLSIPFGPFLGWLSTEQLTVDNWRLVAGIRVALCIGLPIIGVLGLLRFVRGSRALAAGAILLVGTGFPVFFGLSAARDLLQGPAWENVEVEAVLSQTLHLGGHEPVVVPDALVDLSDGRELRTAGDIPVHRGPMRLLVLRGLGRVIDSR